MEAALATITMFAGNFSPRTWAFCEGQFLSINQNQSLYSLLGTTYGGDGETSFALPDLRSRAAIHPGDGPGVSTYSLGQRTGAEIAVLTPANMPQHTHTGELTVAVSTDAGTTDEPDGTILASSSLLAYQNTGVSNSQLAGVSATVAQAGSSQDINLRQPFLGIHFIICIQGLFPARN